MWERLEARVRRFFKSASAGPARCAAGALLSVFVLTGRAANAAQTSQIIDPNQQGVSATSYYPTFGQIPSKMTDNSGLSRPLATGADVPASDAAYPAHDTALGDMY